MQETIRQYARDRLAESGEETGFLTRHRDWYLALAIEAAPELQGTDQARWLRRLETEHANLRGALACSLVGPPGDEAIRMAAALWWFWHVRGYLSEGRVWLSQALATDPGMASRARARALYGAGYLAWRQYEFGEAQALGQESLDVARSQRDGLAMTSALSLPEQVARAQGDHARAEAVLDAGLALFREMGDTWGVATTLMMLGNAARSQGRYPRAREALEESLDRFKVIGDTSGAAAALHFLGLVARDQGDYARAEEAGRDSLRLNRALGDTSRTAFSLHSLGLIARDQSDYTQAEALFEENLALFRALADAWGVPTALVSLAAVRRARGDDVRRAELLLESLRLRRDLRDQAGIAECLEALAGVLVSRQKPERATRLLGAAEAMRETIGVGVPPAQQPGDRGRARHHRGDGHEACPAYPRQARPHRSRADRRVGDRARAGAGAEIGRDSPPRCAGVPRCTGTRCILLWNGFAR